MHGTGHNALQVGAGKAKGRRKLVIDADPGCDDAVALLTAFGCGLFDVVGVTTVFGNADIDGTTWNALQLLHAIESNAVCDEGRDAGACVGKIPVYRGAGAPWVGSSSAPPTYIHGENGLGDVVLTNGYMNGTAVESGERVHRKAEEQSASEFLVEICNQFPGEVSLLCIGRLTNLADALKLDHDLPTKWASVAIMGGAFFVQGNVEEHEHAEGNFMGDPEAAQYVFQHARNVFVVGLDVTRGCPFTVEDMAEISRANSNGRMLSAVYAVYQRFYANRWPQLKGAPPHDAVALLALIHPELYKWKSGQITVTTSGEHRGQSIIHENKAAGSGVPINNVAVAGDCTMIIRQIKQCIMRPRPPFGMKDS